MFSTRKIIFVLLIPKICDIQIKFNAKINPLRGTFFMYTTHPPIETNTCKLAKNNKCTCNVREGDNEVD